MKTKLNFAIPTKALKASIYFAAIDDIRSYLNGVHVTPGVIESSDGYTIARIKDELITIDGATDHMGRPADSIIIPLDQAKALVRQAGRAEIVQCTAGISGSLVIDPIERDYPDVNSVIPAKTSGKTGQFDPEILLRFKRASKDLGRKGAFAVDHNGTDAALVHIAGAPGFVGAIMPWIVT
jgi:DNA polymerase III sliding clamp (beta) subunit (PCNA family)